MTPSRPLPLLSPDVSMRTAPLSLPACYYQNGVITMVIFSGVVYGCIIILERCRYDHASSSDHPDIHFCDRRNGDQNQFSQFRQFQFFGGVFVFLFFYFFVCLLFVWVLFLFSCCFFVVGGGGGGVGGVCCCCFWGEGGSSSAYGISPPVFPGETNCVCPALATDTARESALKADRTIPLRCPNPAIHQQSYIPASVSGVKS